MAQVFSKVLSPTDITRKLALPIKAFNRFHFPEGVNYVHFMVTDSDGIRYNFRLAKRNSGNYSKPEITGGWRQFARNKGLQPGDMVTLNVQQGEAGAVHYIIKVTKMIRLFGRRIYEA
ncbi:hypothetical protein Pint_35240 [Pistacia integerrima]|uniref:Uncharacterized protein n=1 Tax=Pistacia integerrima TaxID=434235 RepID=A0ACC0Y1Z4_9ROSI|nr:hypothetical protein Pint_35240 [Pistacia integerrima]